MSPNQRDKNPAPFRGTDMERRILGYLAAAGMSGTGDIARAVCGPGAVKRWVNPCLYRLHRQGRLGHLQEGNSHAWFILAPDTPVERPETGPPAPLEPPELVSPVPPKQSMPPPGGGPQYAPSSSSVWL